MMYKFAYLYTKLGYVLAVVISILATIACIVMLAVLQFSKPVKPARGFNMAAAAVQAKITAQAHEISAVFGLGSSGPGTEAVQALCGMQWDQGFYTQAAYEELLARREKARGNLDGMRSAVIGSLQSDVDFIASKLAVPSASASAGGDVPSVGSVAGASATVADAFVFGDSATNVDVRIALCRRAKSFFSDLASEASNPENKTKLQAAASTVEDYVRALQGQREDILAEVAARGQDQTEATPAAPEPRKTRRDNVRQELVSNFAIVKEAVVGKWKIDDSFDLLDEHIARFAEEAAGVKLETAAITRDQVVVMIVYALCLLVAFFIGVGSDIVKAILDGAVWLSHIYENTRKDG